MNFWDSSALVLADGRPGDFGFVCLDRRLRSAAVAEGFRALPEED